MAISLDYPGYPPVPTPDPAACSVGRWMTRDGWPGWQEPCDQPGDTCCYPPYVLCHGHDTDLHARIHAADGT